MKTILEMADGDAEAEARMLRKYTEEIRGEVALAVVQRAEADAAIAEKEAELAVARVRRDAIDIALTGRTQHARLMLKLYAMDKLQGRRERNVKFSDFTLGSKRQKERTKLVWGDDDSFILGHLPHCIRTSLDKATAAKMVKVVRGQCVNAETGEELPHEAVTTATTPASEHFWLELGGERIALDTEEENHGNEGDGTDRGDDGTGADGGADAD